MIVVSVNKKIEDVNQAFLDHFGYARDEVIGQSADSLGIWMDRRELRRMKSAIDKKGHISNMEAHFRHKNGDISTVLFSARKTIIGGGQRHVRYY
jgi:PAS domain S-box-containing protein